MFDAVGKSTFGACKKLLKPGGIYCSTDLGPWWQNPFLALLTALLGSLPGQKGKKVIFPIPKGSKEDVMFFKKLIEEGKYQPVIDRRYPFEQIVEAYQYVETGQKIGNVVVKVEHNNNTYGF